MQMEDGVDDHAMALVPVVGAIREPPEQRAAISTDHLGERARRFTDARKDEVRRLEELLADRDAAPRTKDGSPSDQPPLLARRRESRSRAAIVAAQDALSHVLPGADLVRSCPVGRLAFAQLLDMPLGHRCSSRVLRDVIPERLDEVDLLLQRKGIEVCGDSDRIQHAARLRSGSRWKRSSARPTLPARPTLDSVVGQKLRSASGDLRQRGDRRDGCSQSEDRAHHEPDLRARGERSVSVRLQDGYRQHLERLPQRGAEREQASRPQHLDHERSVP